MIYWHRYRLLNRYENDDNHSKSASDDLHSNTSESQCTGKSNGIGHSHRASFSFFRNNKTKYHYYKRKHITTYYEPKRNRKHPRRRGLKRSQIGKYTAIDK